MVRGVTHMGTGLFCWRQVYRGVLRQGGQQVAVKVQRPGVRESIALDIYILRYLAGQHLHQPGSQQIFSGPVQAWCIVQHPGCAAA
jgi:hypothetical protein